MPKEIYDWSAIAASNGLFAPVDGGWPEGMNRQDVNDASREDLASLRRYYNDPEWIRVRYQGPQAGNVGSFARTGANTCTITLTGVDLSSYFRAGRVIKITNGSGVGVDLITQCSINATYGVNVTTITTKATVDVAATDIWANTSSVLRAQGLAENSSEFFIPATADSAGIQAAINAASAAGGGIVFLNQSSYSIGTQIDITGATGNVVIWGKSPQVILLRTAAIGSIINFSNATKSLEIRNVKFDGDWLANPTGNGYGLSVGNCLSVLVDQCDFARCESGIRFTVAGQKRIVVRDSSFTFHRYGISTQSAADTFEGTITGCTFDGTLQSLASPASMRLSGTWLVNGNVLRNASHASLVPVGIYIWDRTVADAGGLRSVVVGNTISGAGATGISIWMGASDGICIGNTISGSSSTTGIRIGSNTAAAAAERIQCSGNSVSAGSLGIQVTEFARHGTIANNSIRPNSGTSLSLAGDLMVVSNNFIRNAPVGIDVLGVSVSCSIIGNTIADPTTSDCIIVRANASATVVRDNFLTGTATRGINVELAAVSTLVVDNYAPNFSTPLTNLSTTTRFARNQELLHSVNDADTGYLMTGTEVSVGTVAMPDGGGIGTYSIEYKLDQIGGATPVLRARWRAGPLGTIADPIAFEDTLPIGPTLYLSDLTNQTFFTLTDATQTLLTLSFERTGGTAGSVDWAYRVTKLTEPLG